MKRFLALLATGALTLGLSSAASAQTQGVQGGALILHDPAAPTHQVVLTVPSNPSAEYTAWSNVAPAGTFPTLTWVAPIPPQNGAQSGFIFTGPLTGVAPAVPSTSTPLAYWLWPNQAGFNNNGGSAGAWDYATINQLGLVTTAGLTANRVVMTDNAGQLATPTAGTTTTVLHGNANPLVQPTYAAVNLTTDVTAVLPIANGGTNANAMANSFGVNYYDGTKINTTAQGAANTILHGNGAAAPTFSAVNLASADVTGILPIANGGTNSNTALNNNRIMVSSGGKIVEAAALTNGQLLIGSIGAAPVAANITPTANQTTVTNGAGTLTIGTVQDIATTSTPTFAGETLNGNLNVTAGGATIVGNTSINNNAAAATTQIGTGTTTGAVTIGNAVGGTAINTLLTVPGIPTAATTGFLGVTGGNQVVVTNASVVTGSGTVNTIPKWSPSATNLADSKLTDDGVTLAYNVNKFTVVSATGNTATGGSLTVGNLTTGVVHAGVAGLLTSSAVNLAGGATEITGVLPIANGGTNANAMANNFGVNYYDGTKIVTTAQGAANTLLHGNGAGAPTFSAVNLASADVTGILPVTNGGTGTGTAFTSGSVVFAGAAGVYNQDNANFFFNDAGDRLGIGTATPTATLGSNIKGITINSADAAASTAIGLSSDAHQLTIQSPTSTNEELELGLNTSAGAGNAFGTIQAYNQGVAPLTLKIQPVGGSVVVGSGTVTLGNLGLGVVHSSAAGLLTSSAVNLASADVTGVLPIANGGTNANAMATAFGVNYYDGTRIVTTAQGASNTLLHGNGAGAPTFAAVNLASADVTGILTVNKGGTGLDGSAAANGTLLVGNGTGYTLANLTPTANQTTVTNGAGTITVGTVQDINTTSTPRFAKLGLNQAVGADVLGVTGSTLLTGTLTVNGGGSTAITATTSAVGLDIASTGAGFPQGATIAATSTGAGSARGVTITASGSASGGGSGIDGAIISGSITSTNNVRGVVAGATTTSSGTATGGQFTATGAGAGAATGVLSSASGSTTSNVGGNFSATTATAGTNTGITVAASNGATNNAIDVTAGNVHLTPLAASLPVKTDASKNLTAAAINLASAEVTGVLPIANGGTNANAMATAFGVNYYDGTRIVTTAQGASNTLLHGNGAGAPTFSAVNLASADVTGILPTGNGGTGIATPANGTLLYGSGANPMNSLAAAVTNGSVLTFNTGTTAPQWTAVLPIANGGTNSSAVLANLKMIYSSAGQIKENANVGVSNGGDITTSGFITTTNALGFTAGAAATAGKLKLFDGSGAATSTGTLQLGTLTGVTPKTYTIPDVPTSATGTFAMLENVQTFTAAQSVTASVPDPGSALTVQNTYSTAGVGNTSTAITALATAAGGNGTHKGISVSASGGAVDNIAVEVLSGRIVSTATPAAGTNAVDLLTTTSNTGGGLVGAALGISNSNSTNGIIVGVASGTPGGVNAMSGNGISAYTKSTTANTYAIKGVVEAASNGLAVDAIVGTNADNAQANGTTADGNVAAAGALTARPVSVFAQGNADQGLTGHYSNGLVIKNGAFGVAGVQPAGSVSNDFSATANFVVNNPLATSNSYIIISPTNSTAGGDQLYVSAKANGSFTVSSNVNTAAAATFDYFIITPVNR